MAKKTTARPPATGKLKRTGTKRAGSPAKMASRTKAPAASPKKKAAPKAAAQLFPIVAVGASAGGLETFTELLRALPADTGMGFVFLQHLSQDSKSMLPEILCKATTMPVTAVTRNAPAQPNHVYVIPPNVDLSFSKEMIRLKPRPQARAPHMPIDFFMRSLAEDCRDRAIGVILSGTGFDGTQGLGAIKAEGGITFAQDEKSAKYPAMPHNAGAAPGVADFTMPPERIAVELARIARHPYLNHVAKVPAAIDLALQPKDKLESVFVVIRKETGLDFSHYKPTTIRRRISRRMLLHKIETLDAYVKLLGKDADEVVALQQDLLINVTNFFRDPDAFQILQETFLPELLDDLSRDTPFRAWIPGCATGEEAYSVAICLLELMDEQEVDGALQIFATDISGSAIAKAREGLYSGSIAADVSPERLRRFFVKTNGGYQISKTIRDMCVFAVQNVVKDPPFSRMDFISCRNVLIYLGTVLQERALNTMHYALKPSEILFLWGSETVAAAANLFHEKNKKGRFYSRRETTSRLSFDFAGSPRLGAIESGQRDADSKRAIEVEKEASSIVLNQFTPPAWWSTKPWMPCCSAAKPIPFSSRRLGNRRSTS